MIVIADTTPLIALMKVNKLDLLNDLFGGVIIPEAVRRELTQNSNFPEERNQITKATFIQVIPVKNQEAVKILMQITGLDRGESEAIILTEEISSALLLIDELHGRKIAKKMSIDIIGSLGVLLSARKDGLITTNEAIADVNQMKLSDIRLSDKVYRNYLEKLSELDSE